MSLTGNTPPKPNTDSEQLSDYYERKVAGVCTRPGCQSEPHDDLGLCLPHLLDARGRKARLRDERKRQGLCVDCGGKAPRKPRKARGRRSRSRFFERCRACLKSNSRNKRDNSGNNQHAPRSSRIVEKVEQDGVYGTRVRKRYVGQGKRGRSSREDESTRDINEAIKTLERAKDGLERLRDQTLQGPQRTNAVREVIAQVRLAERFGDEVVERYEPGGVTK